MLNPRVLALNKSATLKITAATKKLIKEGEDVVNLAAGEPDFDTPQQIKEAAKQAINEGFTKYTPSTGTPELKNAIAQKLIKENGLSVDASNIIVTAGAKYAIFIGIFTLVQPDDEVIMPCPYWVSYPEIVKLAGAKSYFLETKAENDFKINPQDLEKAITPKTKVLILNYPNNPTGTTYSKKELEQIYEIAKKKNIFVLSDEIYESLVYDNTAHLSFASIPGAEKLTLTVNGFSKAFSMTGWRVGYLVGPKKIISAASKIIDHTTSCLTSISQKAALAAFELNQWRLKARAEFENRRNLLWEGLNSCDKIKVIKPKGTFYMFCDITETGLSSFDFANKLLESQRVSCIPASAFGKEGFVRLSFSTNTEQLSKGVDRIKKFISTL